MMTHGIPPRQQMDSLLAQIWMAERLQAHEDGADDDDDDDGTRLSDAQR